MPREPRPDVDALIASMKSPSAPSAAPAWTEEAPVRETRRSRPRTWAWSLVPAGAVALGLCWFQVTRDPWSFRGEGPNVEVGLRLVSDHEGVAQRVPVGGELPLGDAIFFRAEASREITLVLWVESAVGREEIARFKATTTPTDVKVADGWVSYLPDKPGTYAFFLAQDPDLPCVPPSCVRIAVEVK